MRIMVGISNGLMINGQFMPSGFMEQIITELKNSGNDILVYVPNRFQSKLWQGDNPIQDNIDTDKLEQDIRNFNPQLIITFNNTIYNDIIKITDCPIVVWGADSDALWNSKDIIKNNLDRYYFFCFSEQEMKPRQQYFGANDNRMFLMRPATNITNTKSAKDKNISFIGSFFSTNWYLQDFIEKHRGKPELKKLIDNFQTYFLEKCDLLDGIKNEDLINDFNKIPESEYITFFSGEKRTTTLAALADMGLHVWGTQTWEKIKPFLPSLYACIHQDKVITVSDNSYVYNTSKICININHDQSVHGMNFRICDVLASGGALLSSSAPFVYNQFKDIDIPMFNTPYEARDLCKKYLNDEALRTDLVNRSNNAIENGWRWSHRFMDMSQILNMDIYRKEEKSSKIKRFLSWGADKTKGKILYLEPQLKQ